MRGIEHLVAAEVAAIGRVDRIRHREVWFTAPLTPAVLRLRTADDVFLIGRVFGGVGHTRADLSRVTRAALRLPVECLLAARAACGVPPVGPGASVVASFVGRRNYSRYDLEDAVGAALPGYVSRRRRVPPEGGQSWRLTVVGEEAVLALRVAGRPLHRRPYRTRTVPGSLHPPLAAALARLAGVTPGMTVLNPCCGAGTLLLESFGVLPAGRDVGTDAGPALGSTSHSADATPDSARDQLCIDATRADAAPDSARDRQRIDASPTADSVSHRFGIDAPPVSTGQRLGVDVSAAAVACARANGVRALCVADAGRLPIASGSVDRVLVNPPWEHQVASLGVLAGAPARLWESIQRVLAPDGLVAAVVPSVALPGFRVRTSLEVRVAGRSALLVLAAPA